MNTKLLLKTLVVLAISPFFLLSGCSKDNEEENLLRDPFYKGALLNADLNLLNNYWSVYEVNFDGKSAEVTQIYGNCDRDFFNFSKSGAYLE